VQAVKNRSKDDVCVHVYSRRVEVACVHVGPQVTNIIIVIIITTRRRYCTVVTTYSMNSDHDSLQIQSVTLVYRSTLDFSGLLSD